MRFLCHSGSGSLEILGDVRLAFILFILMLKPKICNNVFHNVHTINFSLKLYFQVV